MKELNELMMKLLWLIAWGISMNFIISFLFTESRKKGDSTIRDLYQVYLKEIESCVGNISDSYISEKLKILVEILKKVPKYYFTEGKLGKYYIPELLLLLRSYCNLLDKDRESKTNVLEAIEVVTGVAISILNTIDESEKVKLEINSDVLNQVAKMDGYLSDTIFDTCSERKRAY